MNAKIAISVLHFELSQETRQQICGAVECLFSHASSVARVDVTVEGEYRHNTQILYNVTLRAQLLEAVLFELKQGDHLLQTVQAAAASLDHRLQEMSLIPKT